MCYSVESGANAGASARARASWESTPLNDEGAAEIVMTIRNRIIPPPSIVAGYNPPSSNLKWAPPRF